MICFYFLFGKIDNSVSDAHTQAMHIHLLSLQIFKIFQYNKDYHNFFPYRAQYLFAHLVLDFNIEAYEQ